MSDVQTGDLPAEELAVPILDDHPILLRALT